MLAIKILLITIAILAGSNNSVNGLFGYSRSDKVQQLFREPPPPPPKSSDPDLARSVQLDWIEQRVDNFDPSNHDTYMMRFYRNGMYFYEGGPIFIMVGGEWTISQGWLQGGHMYDMAVVEQGYMFYTEHRYYGESRPTEDASVENLRYLTIDQALADLAHFIVDIKKDPGLADAPVILVGGSYAATMVAWFRKKYPHLSAGAWASSAPVLAKVDFIEYKEVVGGSILSIGGWGCFDRIENAFRELEQYVENNQLDFIEDKFNLCYPLATQNDIWSFFSLLTDVMAGYVQYHQPGDIEGICYEIMSSSPDNDLDGFANWIIPIITYDGCIDADFEAGVEYFRQDDWNAGPARSGYRQWIYQTCAEFGWYQTSGSRFQPFGSSFPVELYYDYCTEIYGDIFNNDTIHNNAERINRMYGGLLMDATNIYFSHGMLDPWRTMGIQSDINHLTPTMVIPGASHCNDMQSIDWDDYRRPQLRVSQQLTQYHISNWINQAQGEETPFKN